MMVEESSEAAELDSYHRDINPGLDAGLESYIVAACRRWPINHLAARPKPRNLPALVAPKSMFSPA